MTTVKETNEILSSQNLNIKLPYPEEWIVTNIEILEKKDLPGAVNVLLGIKMINNEGKEISDLYFSETDLEREPIYKSTTRLIKNDLLPQRDASEFKDEKEALDYIKHAMESLVKDKGYEIKKSSTEMYGEKSPRGFFINFSVYSDQKALDKVDMLIKLREQLGDVNDYGLVIPAFQESLGISRMDQDRWADSHLDFFSRNHIGIFAVDNKDPNSIYPLTTYPKEKELRKYFIKTSSSWTQLRSRYASFQARAMANR